MATKEIYICPYCEGTGRQLNRIDLPINRFIAELEDRNNLQLFKNQPKKISTSGYEVDDDFCRECTPFILEERKELIKGRWGLEEIIVLYKVYFPVIC